MNRAAIAGSKIIEVIEYAKRSNLTETQLRHAVETVRNMTRAAVQLVERVPVLTQEYSHTNRTLTAKADGVPFLRWGNGPFNEDLKARFDADCARIIAKPEALAANVAFLEHGQRVMAQTAVLGMRIRRRHQRRVASLGEVAR